MKKYISIFFILSILCSFPAFGQKIKSKKDCTSSKIYVEPNLICIHQNGLALILKNEILHIQHLHSDESGFYILTSELDSKIDNRCLNGHIRWCTGKLGCGGCAAMWCPFCCKCNR